MSAPLRPQPQESSGRELAQFIERLRSLDERATLSDALAILTPPQPAAQEATRRCALLRWFNQRVYEFVCADLPARPAFAEFVESDFVQRLSPGRWTLDDETRTRLLQEWQVDETTTETWKEWNRQIGEFLLTDCERRPQLRLDALYHLAASPDPKKAVPYFRAWYDDADTAFDLAQCNALLEILRLQQNWRGQELSAEWEAYRLYYSARRFFEDDYYKTGSYFERDAPLQAFRRVYRQQQPRDVTDPWILHIHATGGTGKTMFLRWLIARDLVRDRVPCARVDFDDFALKEVLDYPLRLFVKIVEQWSHQGQGTRLTPLLEKLNLEVKSPGWNTGVLSEVRRQLRGSQIEGPLVVVLDTLEEATIAAADWLRQCIAALREIHDLLPNLTLVLSGRYDMSIPRQDATTATTPPVTPPILDAGEFVAYELPRFTETEAHDYLSSRGIEEGPVRDAIVKRANVDETVEGSSSTVASVRNPFKLAIFAELVLSRQQKISPDEILKFPRADIAYLIERVIKRIESQPVRWVIRYGAIARHITQDFIDHVLIPPLRQALRGELPDQVNEQLSSEYVDVWKPEPELADTVGAAALWDQLKSYARERGWISMTGTGARAELRFHPEVIVPTRDLLRLQQVFSNLQERACEHFDERARAAAEAGRSDEAVANICEAVFHRFQLEGTGAKRYWLNAVRTAEQWGPSRAIAVATEIAGRDYAEGRRIPIASMATPHTLLVSHCDAADLLMQAGGVEFSDRHPHWFDFRQHLETAALIIGDHPQEGLKIPPLLRCVYDAFETTSPQERERRLRAGLETRPVKRDQFFLSLHLGNHYGLMRSTAEAAFYYREAMRLLLGSNRTGVQGVDIALALANVYEYEGVHSAVISAQHEALSLTFKNSASRLRVVSRQAAYALDVADSNGALDRIEELERTETPNLAQVRLLKARFALLLGDPVDTIGHATAGLAMNPPAQLRAPLLDQHGEASALLLGFDRATTLWEQAASAYDQIGGDRAAAGGARCALLKIRMTALSVGHLNAAWSLCDAAATLRGMRDAGLFVESQLLRSYVAFRKDGREAALSIFQPLLKPRQPQWPAPLRARVATFGLLFGLTAADEVEGILQLIADLQPLTRRESLLEWAEHSPGGTTVDAGTMQRLLGLFGGSGRSKRATGRRTRGYIYRAELCRALGHPDQARAQIESARAEWSSSGSAADVLVSWELNVARERLQMSTNFQGMLETADLLPEALAQFRHDEPGADAPVVDAIRCMAALEAIGSGDMPQAHSIAKGGFPLLEREAPGLWHARILALRMKLSPADAATAQQLRALHDELGQPPSWPRVGEITRPPGIGPPVAADAAGGGPIVSLTEATVPTQLIETSRHPDAVIDLMLADWKHFANDLSLPIAPQLPVDKRVGLRTTGLLASLPWELATALADREVVWRFPERPLLQPGLASKDGILLVRPREDEHELNLEAASGGQLELIYRWLGQSAAVSFAPDPRALEEDLYHSKPVLLHFVAAVRESHSGMSLDFESSDTRASSYAQSKVVPQRRLNELLLTPTRLDTLFTKLSYPPFVILDIARPRNLAEAVRMLLLRNLFAAQLVELGHVSGVLACGLAASFERFDVTRELVRGLLREGPGGAVSALRRHVRPLDRDNFEFVLPRLGPCLWTNHLDDAVLPGAGLTPT
jgi:hypothetical protein